MFTCTRKTYLAKILKIQILINFTLMDVRKFWNKILTVLGSTVTKLVFCRTSYLFFLCSGAHLVQSERLPEPKDKHV